MKSTHNPYKEAQILTAPSEKLLIMLYDACIVSIETAIAKLKAKSLQYDIVNNNLQKAQEILTELMATLNFEKGGELAKNLDSLYSYFIRRLMEGNMKKEIKPLREVLEHLQNLREAWYIASQNVDKIPVESMKDNSADVFHSSDSVVVQKNKSKKNEPSQNGNGGFNIQG